MKNKLPVNCPSCGSGLSVKNLSCNNCGTGVEGNYELPPFLRLDEEELNFINSFILNSGSIKQMAKEMGKSYPFVRNYLDDLINKIKENQNKI